uniref:Uncharacterized protein n=1 Tax=Solanum lycopersicum TaxID=4081 RepID=A0A3Q7FH11_SOLLC|nr:uncharacterized protein LOC101247498 isoform X1 [Solanum lycopersicum]XP_010317642.1 uncharacterized protein LOC101247498 isoform X1 [Solanum lycopersicum]
MGSISGNMLNTVSPEVAKSIDLELSWKSVTKKRRSRRTVARRLNEGMKMNRSPKRVGDFSGSGSDKQIHGAGSWSSDKAEHVPIKKRRNLVQTSSAQSRNPSIDCEDSLSPQSRLATPMPSEDSDQISIYSHSSDHWSSDPRSRGRALRFDRKAARKVGLSDKLVDAKSSKIATRKLYNSEDFLGIVLLADAACTNYKDGDLDNAKEAHAMVACAAPGGFVGSTPHPKDISALKELADPGRGDMMHGSNMESSTVNESAVALKSFADFKEPSVVSRPVSPKVDRIHWDLNTSIETWVQPPKDSSVENAFANGLDDGAQNERHIIEICDKKGGFEYCKPISGPADQNATVYEFAEVCKLESVSVNAGEFGNIVSHSTKALDSLSAQRETFDELVTGDAPLADSSLVKSENASCMLVSNGLITNASDGLVLTQIRESSVKAAGFNKAALSEVPYPAKPDCENASNKYIDCSDPITSEVSDTSILNVMDVESSDSNPHDNILAIDSQMQLEGNEVISKFSDNLTSNQVEKCTTSGKDSSKSCNEGLQIDDTSQFARSASAFEESHNSDISHEDHGQLISREHVTRTEAGYDSPFEDGELRGSIMYSLEDNEIKDGEDECVDYASEGRVDLDFDASDYPSSEMVEAGSDGSQSTEKRISSTSRAGVDFVKSGSAKNFIKRHFNREDNSIGDSGGKKGLRPGSGSRSRSTALRFNDKIGRKEDAFRKAHTSDRMAAYEFRGSYTGEISSKANRGKLQSRIEGPLHLGAADGNSAARKYQNRPHNLIGCYNKPVREVSPDKFVGRYRSGYNSQDKRATNGQWNSSNSRDCYPNAYRDPESDNYSRHRNFANSADKLGGFSSRDHQQSINFPSEGARRPPLRRRSSVERDDYYDVHRRMVAVRGAYRSRNGAESISERVARGAREEGYEFMPGDVRVPHYVPPRGERTGSPASSRVARIPLLRRRSRSRSRTPSPYSWHTQRERDLNSRRRHSRSPDIRSDARMSRTRMPFRKHGFTANYGKDFSSPTRGHCPPERSSRWIDERSFADENSKNRWSRKNN